MGQEQLLHCIFPALAINSEEMSDNFQKFWIDTFSQCENTLANTIIFGKGLKDP